MAKKERDERKAAITPAATTEPDNGDPRDTDHPTGSKQAAETPPTIHQVSSNLGESSGS